MEILKKKNLYLKGNEEEEKQKKNNKIKQRKGFSFH